MGAKSHDPVARIEAGGDFGALLAHAGHLHSLRLHRLAGGVIAPNRGAAPLVEQGGEGHLDRRGADSLRRFELQGDGRPERSVFTTTRKDVARPVSSSGRIGNGGQLPQARRVGCFALGIERCLGFALGQTTACLGQEDLRLPRPVARQPDHGLARSDHFPGIGGNLHHHAVGIGLELGVTCLVLDLAGLGFGIGELGDGCIGRTLVLVVGLLRGPAVGHELTATLLVGLGLDHLGAGSLDGGARGIEGEGEVGPVEAHQRLAEVHAVTRIDETLEDLASYPEAKVALGAGPDHAGVARHDAGAWGDLGHLDEGRLRVHGRLGRRAGRKGQTGQTDYPSRIHSPFPPWPIKSLK
ncbi:protein of unknown function [Methylorubrum extorquens]|uniref:Uncharacterized protein n=1 Tax=Methylorubrum extorquens TaxID=408 RepID=A0A2N9AMG0_METEX|nr:protein of unknown function [Methylorubrum extorquens]